MLATIICHTGIVYAADDVNQTKENIEVEDGIRVLPYLGSSNLKLSGGDIGSTIGSGSSVGVTAASNFGLPNSEFELGFLLMDSTSEKYSFQNFSFINSKYTIKHIAIPMTAKYNFWKYSETSDVYVKTGLTPTLITSAKFETEGWFDQSSSSVDIKSDLNSFDTHFNLGFGYAYQLSETIDVIAEGIYSQGLLNVLKNGNAKISGISWNAALSIKL